MLTQARGVAPTPWQAMQMAAWAACAVALSLIAACTSVSKTKPVVSTEQAYDRCRMAGDTASLVVIRHNDGRVDYALSGGTGGARIERCMADFGVKDLPLAVVD